MRGAKKVGRTYHHAPTYLQDAEVVAATDDGDLRMVQCQGGYTVERREFDLLGHPRWVDANAREVAEWFRIFLADLRGDE